MDKRKLEALCEAVISYSGYREPNSPVYQARNPGNLKAFKPDQPQDEEGRRIYSSVIDGMQSLLWDMQLKLSGQSVARLTPESTLTDLVKAYHLPDLTSQAWARFLRAALQTQEINSKTTISFFTKG
jgi:hypothetical protein